MKGKEGSIFTQRLRLEKLSFEANHMAWMEAASLTKRRKLNRVRVGSTDLNLIHVQRWLQQISIKEPSELLMLLMLLMTHIWYSHLLGYDTRI